MLFVDTSFWIAARNRRDDRHERARSLLRRRPSEELATTNLVRGETWTLLRRWVGHAAAVDFFEHVERTERLRLVRVDSDLEDEAVAWLRRHDERPYSFVDATSFAVMRSLGLREALTFDDDFSAAGFVVLSA